MNPDSKSWLGSALNLIGIVVVGLSFSRVLYDGAPAWIVWLGCTALVAWLALVLIPRTPGWLVCLILIVMVLGGAISTVSTSGLLVVTVIVAVLRAVADPRWPIWFGFALALTGISVVALGIVVTTLPPLGLLSIEGGIVIASLGGVNRRQYRISERRARAAREEQARVLVLAERQSVASDIHDVLAHSLGGLIIQLDAVEGLLEAGRIPDAAARARDARALAVSGLAEARRAVGVLRDAGSSPADLPSIVDDLVRAHRSLGGEVELTVTGRQHPLDEGSSAALSRVLQESLTNARKHASGQPVSVSLAWHPAGATLSVSNPVASEAGSLAATGGGHGIPGMAERFTTLVGSTFRAASQDGEFVVAASVLS